jgi:hypothetical protein
MAAVDEPIKVAAVATRVTREERDAIDDLPAELGEKIAEKLRVLLRFGLSNPDAVLAWFLATDGTPLDQPDTVRAAVESVT